MKPVLLLIKSLVILVAALGVGFPRMLLSQATFGNIIGTVTDPGGAVIVGAKVTITSAERGRSYQRPVTNRATILRPIWPVVSTRWNLKLQVSSA